MFTSENLLAILLLLPGFLASRMSTLISVQRKKSLFDAIAEVVLYEFVIIVLFTALSSMWRWPCIALPGTGELQYRPLDAIRNNAHAFITLTTISIILGGVFGWLHNIDQPLGLLRALHITKQSIHATVWQETFSSMPHWILVHLGSGERIIGWPDRYSDTPEEGCLFLREAAYVSPNNELTEIHGPGIFLPKLAGIHLIEFLDSDTSALKGDSDDGEGQEVTSVHPDSREVPSEEVGHVGEESPSAGRTTATDPAAGQKRKDAIPHRSSGREERSQLASDAADRSVEQ